MTVVVAIVIVVNVIVIVIGDTVIFIVAIVSVLNPYRKLSNCIKPQGKVVGERSQRVDSQWRDNALCLLNKTQCILSSSITCREILHEQIPTLPDLSRRQLLW